MKAELRAGAEIDFQSAEEARAETDRIIDAIKTTRDGTIVVDHVAGVVVDAAGNLGGGELGAGVAIYDVPTGRAARLNRVGIGAYGYTPTAPLATGWIGFYSGRPAPSSQLQFLPVSGTVLPVIMTEGDDSAMALQNGETLVVAGAGLPANLAISFRLQVRLDPGYMLTRAPQ